MNTYRLLIVLMFTMISAQGAISTTARDIVLTIRQYANTMRQSTATVFTAFGQDLKGAATDAQEIWTDSKQDLLALTRPVIDALYDIVREPMADVPLVKEDLQEFYERGTQYASSVTRPLRTLQETITELFASLKEAWNMQITTT